MKHLRLNRIRPVSPRALAGVLLGGWCLVCAVRPVLAQETGGGMAGGAGATKPEGTGSEVGITAPGQPGGTAADTTKSPGSTSSEVGITSPGPASSAPASGSTTNGYTKSKTKSAKSKTRPMDAKQAMRLGIRPPWPGQRVLLLMPLRLGEKWNAPKEAGELMLPEAETLLQRALQNTGKFSTVQFSRYSPIVQRALAEKRITEDEFKAFQVASTTGSSALDQVRPMLLKLFTGPGDQAPMVTEFRLEEIYGEGSADHIAVKMVVTGVLYDLANAAAKSVKAESEPHLDGRSTMQRALVAAEDAFQQIAAAFTEPLPDIELPLPELFPATTPTKPVMPTPDQHESPVRSPDSWLPPGGIPPLAPGGKLGTAPGNAMGVPEVPSSGPPLGLPVPETSTVGR